MGYKCKICDNTDTRYCPPVEGWLCGECASSICSDGTTLNYNITPDDFEGEHWGPRELEAAHRIAFRQAYDDCTDNQTRERWESLANCVAENYHKGGGDMRYLGGYIDETSESLFWAMFYNGQEDNVERLYWDMKAFVDKGDYTNAFSRPDYITSDDIEVLWMILVQSFGEYGTSPRGGWFGEHEKPAEAVEYLRQNIESTFDSQLTLYGKNA